MSKVENLIANYRQIANLPWQENIAGPQKVWFAIYDPSQERRVRLRLDEFALATREAGHRWHVVDITDAFARWMAGHRYREAYFESPQDLDLALNSFTDAVAQQIENELTSEMVDVNTVVAIVGAGALFGLTRVSTVIEKVAPHIRGRLLVFFPGHYDGSNNYRLLDARDGWNYLAIPITA
jgi:hypothetical protein